ncbi:hypothetical protein BDZ90DRAFT_232964 [Jaminaea rosea]|uniref:ELYS-like domain-containing protein n=1 Tax=Jaminaea rosea TaxID=1569628 RepID=A0A316UNM0_9BASI|nr:hypothetical protein BDZ90DRAFT_232964 [Jaminaea rosea]PWN26869.1 hypothetical protein BDZ90DRAFT_232964 [Jaminaea rosea]
MASHQPAGADDPLLVDDSDTLSYFTPTLIRKPTPLRSPSIISSLLTSAGVSATYPSSDLTSLVSSIEEAPQFDTLRRNGLLLYLIIDVATHPSLVDTFCTNRLIPDFWRRSVEAYHAFDHGHYARAMPWLSAENAAPYSELILTRLDPSEDAKLARFVVQHLIVARPLVQGEEAGRAVLVGKAIVEGLGEAMQFARSSTAGSKALWPWLFGKRRPKLLAELVRLPLSPAEVDELRSFALVPTTASGSASSSVAAQRRAVDALLLRLLNAGRIVEALRLDRAAEENGLGGEGGEEDAGTIKAVKQRREMLRLARQSLPATLRLELEDEEDDYANTPDGTRPGMQLDSTGDSSMMTGSRDPSCPGSALNKPVIAPSSPLVTLPRSASRTLALASQSPLAGTIGPSSSFTGSPRPQSRPPLATRGYASPSPRPQAAALPFTNDGPRQTSSSFSSSSKAGPYARLAAQLAAQQSNPAAAADDSGSNLLSSLLPQKRGVSSTSLAATGDAGVGSADISMDRTMTPPPAGSAFEVPKRRYVAKPAAATTDSQPRGRGQRQAAAAAPAASASPAVATPARSRVGGARAGPHKKQRQEAAEPEKAPQRAAQKGRTMQERMPGSFFDDEDVTAGQQDEAMGVQQHEEAEEQETQPQAKATKRGAARRGGSATPARRTTTTRRRRGADASPQASSTTSDNDDDNEDDATYAPPTTRRMTRSQSVLSAISDAAAEGKDSHDTWTTTTTTTSGDNSARDPLYEQEEEEDEEDEQEEDEGDETTTDDQPATRRRTRTRSGQRETAKRTTRQRSVQTTAAPTSSTPKTSPQKKRTTAAAASATSTPTGVATRRSTRRGGAA